MSIIDLFAQRGFDPHDHALQQVIGRRIDHIDQGGGRFRFVLDLRHPLLGELIHQVGEFADQPVLEAG